MGTARDRHSGRHKSAYDADTVRSIPPPELLSKANREDETPTTRFEAVAAPAPSPRAEGTAPTRVHGALTPCPCGAAHAMLCPSCGRSQLADYEREASYLERGLPGAELGEVLALLSDITADLAVVRGPGRQLLSDSSTAFDRATRLAAAAATISRWVNQYYSPTPQSPPPAPPLSELTPEGTGVSLCPTVTFRAPTSEPDSAAARLFGRAPRRSDN